MSQELCGCGAVVKNDACSDLMRHSYYLVGKLEAKNEEIERLINSNKWNPINDETDLPPAEHRVLWQWKHRESIWFGYWNPDSKRIHEVDSPSVMQLKYAAAWREIEVYKV